MCIRDRLTIFSLGNIAVHAEKVNDCIKIVLQQTVPGDYIPPINKEGGPVAVSYTHLDVYKRQHLAYPYKGRKVRLYGL